METQFIKIEETIFNIKYITCIEAKEKHINIKYLDTTYPVYFESVTAMRTEFQKLEKELKPLAINGGTIQFGIIGSDEDARKIRDSLE